MFLLKRPPNKRGDCLVILSFNYHGNRFRMSTDLNILPDLWDPKRERPKRTFKYYPQFAAILDRMDTALNEAYLELLIDCIPSMDTLRAAVLTKLNRTQPPTVAQFAKTYAESKQGARGTVLHFHNVAGKLEAYNPKLTFDRVDLAMMLDFRDWLLNQKYEANTVAGWFKRFKTILAAAVEQGVTDNVKWKHSKAVASPAETTAIFLNEEELDRIRLTVLPEWLDKYRDILLVACYTGCRFNDIFNINATSFVENGRFFRITDQKENALAQIPAHPVVMAIMTRYGWNLPKVSNVKFNLYIKEVGKIARIDQGILVTKYPGGIRTDTLRPKYELITSHTGRRSLVTNLIIAGLNHTVIRSISGHKTQAAFERYIRLAPADSLKIAFKSGFFTAALKAAK